MLDNILEDMQHYDRQARYYRDYLPLAKQVTFEQVEDLLYNLPGTSPRRLYALSMIFQWLAYVEETDKDDRRNVLAKAFSVLLDVELEALYGN